MPALRPASRTCLCRTCGDYFGSPSAFDKHRTGPWSGRRCLAPEERPRLVLKDGRWMTG
jgi:hypothetical protein